MERAIQSFIDAVSGSKPPLFYWGVGAFVVGAFLWGFIASWRPWEASGGLKPGGEPPVGRQDGSD